MQIKHRLTVHMPRVYAAKFMLLFSESVSIIFFFYLFPSFLSLVIQSVNQQVSQYVGLPVIYSAIQSIRNLLRIQYRSKNILQSMRLAATDPRWQNKRG
jgi:hypothetical protein